MSQIFGLSSSTALLILISLPFLYDVSIVWFLRLLFSELNETFLPNPDTNRNKTSEKNIRQYASSLSSSSTKIFGGKYSNKLFYGIEQQVEKKWNKYLWLLKVAEQNWLSELAAVGKEGLGFIISFSTA